MSQEAVERVLGRLLTDDRFRRSAKESLEVACMQQGYVLTTTELSLLSGLKFRAINEVAAQLDPGLCRAVTSWEKSFSLSNALIFSRCPISDS